MPAEGVKVCVGDFVAALENALGEYSLIREWEKDTEDRLIAGAVRRYLEMRRSEVAYADVPTNKC